MYTFSRTFLLWSNLSLHSLLVRTLPSDDGTRRFDVRFPTRICQKDVLTKEYGELDVVMLADANRRIHIIQSSYG